MNITTERDIFTVSEIVGQARELLETAFKNVWVEGELSNLKQHTSGHWYFTLKDANSQLRSAMFRGSNRSVRFEVEDGLKVVALGRLSLYTARGDFQMVVEALEPAGLGALQLSFEQLKKQLQEEGLFDQSRKKELPDYPRRIAVVTSPTGAAIQDILNVTGRRSPLADISVYPVRVQGDGAAQEIAHAIDRLNEEARWDVIICGRGGGSIEDLWAFNEECVARAIAASELPVISAVGHEIDYTIADFVADVRAETPTAAAEMVVRDRRELKARVDHLTAALKLQLKERLDRYYLRLEQLQDSPVMKNPLRVYEPLAQKYDELSNALQKNMANRLRFMQERFRSLVAQLEALSPLNVMSRGYSVVFRLPDEKLVTQAVDLTLNQRLKIRLAEGSIEAEVKKINK